MQLLCAARRFIFFRFIDDVSETKRLGRRLSTASSSCKQNETIGMPITTEESEIKISSQAPTRRRRSRVQLHETPESEGSALFSKPSSSTRPRHSTARRYSPSPENRTKLKSIAALLQNKQSRRVTKWYAVFYPVPADYGVGLFCKVL
ncbi:hypothetical protein COOONC_02992 [Cooperia oncophora]